jgi:hypothetical protein
MLPVESQHVNGNSHLDGVDKDLNGHQDNEYHRINEKEGQSDNGTGFGAIMVNLLTGVRKLPASMKVVLLVMAFCWVSLAFPIPLAHC